MLALIKTTERRRDWERSPPGRRDWSWDNLAGNEKIELSAGNIKIIIIICQTVIYIFTTVSLSRRQLAVVSQLFTLFCIFSTGAARCSLCSFVRLRLQPDLSEEQQVASAHHDKCRSAWLLAQFVSIKQKEMSASPPPISHTNTCFAWYPYRHGLQSLIRSWLQRWQERSHLVRG